VRIFAVGLLESTGGQLLTGLADQTGGRYFAPTSAENAGAALSNAIRK